MNLPSNRITSCKFKYTFKWQFVVENIAIIMKTLKILNEDDAGDAILEPSFHNKIRFIEGISQI